MALLGTLHRPVVGKKRESFVKLCRPKSSSRADLMIVDIRPGWTPSSHYAIGLNSDPQLQNFEFQLRQLLIRWQSLKLFIEADDGKNFKL